MTKAIRKLVEALSLHLQDHAAPCTDAKAALDKARELFSDPANWHHSNGKQFKPEHQDQAKDAERYGSTMVASTKYMVSVNRLLPPYDKTVLLQLEDERLRLGFRSRRHRGLCVDGHDLSHYEDCWCSNEDGAMMAWNVAGWWPLNVVTGRATMQLEGVLHLTEPERPNPYGAICADCGESFDIRDSAAVQRHIRMAGEPCKPKPQLDPDLLEGALHLTEDRKVTVHTEESGHTGELTKDVELGLYRVLWRSGGYSMAAVYQDHDARRWFAPVNWLAPALLDDHLEAIAKMERVRGAKFPESRQDVITVMTKEVLDQSKEVARLTAELEEAVALLDKVQPLIRERYDMTKANIRAFVGKHSDEHGIKIEQPSQRLRTLQEQLDKAISLLPPWQRPNDHGEWPGDICCDRAGGAGCYEHDPANYPDEVLALCKLTPGKAVVSAEDWAECCKERDTLSEQLDRSISEGAKANAELAEVRDQLRDTSRAGLAEIGKLKTQLREARQFAGTQARTISDLQETRRILADDCTQAKDKLLNVTKERDDLMTELADATELLERAAPVLQTVSDLDLALTDDIKEHLERD